jgi:hypothetical protein
MSGVGQGGCARRCAPRTCNRLPGWLFISTRPEADVSEVLRDRVRRGRGCPQEVPRRGAGVGAESCGDAVEDDAAPGEALATVTPSPVMTFAAMSV